MTSLPAFASADLRALTSGFIRRSKDGSASRDWPDLRNDAEVRTIVAIT